jgi:hypothetical protein
VATLPCIQHILDANRLTWSDVGHHPDCLFASFMPSQQQGPTWDLIIDTQRKCRNWLRLTPPGDLFPEAWTKRCNEYSIFNPGRLVTTKRREGDEHTLRGLAGVYQCRLNIIVVSSNHHHTKKIPPPNTPSLGKIWLIFLTSS